MIAGEMRHLAGWCERHAASLSGLADQFTMLGLAAHLANLADRVAALEAPQAARLIDLPEGVVELARFRARTTTRHPHDMNPQGGGTAA
jgi:hypothetical protein